MAYPLFRFARQPVVIPLAQKSLTARYTKTNTVLNDTKKAKGDVLVGILKINNTYYDQ